MGKKGKRRKGRHGGEENEKWKEKGEMQRKK